MAQGEFLRPEHIVYILQPDPGFQGLNYEFLIDSHFPYLLYFSGYKMGFFLSKMIKKSRSTLLDRSRYLGLFGKGETGIKAKFRRTGLVICSHFREEKNPSYCQINMVKAKSIFRDPKFYIIWLLLESQN